MCICLLDVVLYNGLLHRRLLVRILFIANDSLFTSNNIYYHLLLAEVGLSRIKVSSHPVPNPNCHHNSMTKLLLNEPAMKIFYSELNFNT